MFVIKKLCKAAFIAIVNVIVIFFVTVNSDESVQTLSKYGSTGEEVKQIQQVLKEQGYYSATVDGIFGNETKDAVVAYQKDNGLDADGVVGPNTLKTMGISSETSGTGNLTGSDVKLLAKVISAESRGEPYTGQVAVGAVILNRIEHPSFPNTLSGVVYQPGAFSCMTDGQIDQTVSDSALRAARDAINGFDPSGGAIYYYNPEKTSNKFMLSRPVITVIGAHKFCS